MLTIEEKDKTYKNISDYMLKNYDIFDYEYTNKDLIYESLIENNIVENTKEVKDIFNQVLTNIDKMIAMLED